MRARCVCRGVDRTHICLDAAKDPPTQQGQHATIREHCGGDLAKLADAWACLAWGTPAERRAFFGETVYVTSKDRLFALAELRHTSIGRPKQTLEHEASDENPLPKLMIVVQPAGRKLSPWVFPNADGKSLDGDNVRHRVFYRILDRAGMRQIRFHDLRHYSASRTMPSDVGHQVVLRPELLLERTRAGHALGIVCLSSTDC